MIISAAIRKFNPGSSFSVEETDDGYVLNWQDTKPRPTSQQIEEWVSIYRQELLLDKIKDSIYKSYPPEKQQQDLMWTNYHRTNLVAADEADVEAKVVGFAQAVIGGKTIAQAIKSVNADFKPAYTKLVKIALRTSWARQCIDEGLAALAESREPEYPPFPEL